jgi:Cu+-exporting ATPase
VIVTVLAMFGHRLAGSTWPRRAGSSWCCRPIVLWAGWPFFVRGAQSVVQPQPEHVDADRPGHRRGLRLQRGGHGRAAGVSGLVPAMGRVAVYFEAAAVIISLTLLGQMLELKARSQTSAAIKSLLGLAPKTARRIARRWQRRRRAADPRARRRPLRVRPGEKVPVDGVVTRRAAARSTNRCSPASRCR